VDEPADGVALTLDDGPDPEQTPRVLDALAEAGAHATFFVIGRHVRRYPQVVRRIVAEGHALGLHSDSHSHWFNLWPPWRVTADLRACGAAIADAAGVSPPRLFRPPIGLKNPVVGHVAGRLGLVCVTWTAGGRDTARRTLENVERGCLPGLRPGGIIMLHDGGDPSWPRSRPHAVPLVRRLLEHAARASLVARALTIAGDKPVLQTSPRAGST
jgi:peptidoglycan/xylan/chitin deacetylase (PgdA/CDA1 family)